MIVSPYGMGTFNILAIKEATKCVVCKRLLNPKNITSIILTQCKFSIRGQKANDEKVERPFQDAPDDKYLTF